MTEALEPNQPTPPGARCGAHPERAAVVTCARCGDFACSDCASRGLCAACVERAPDAVPDLDRDTWRVGSVFRRAWRTLNDRPGSTLGMFWALLLPSLLVITVPVFLVMPGLLSRKVEAAALYTTRARLITQGITTVAMLLVSPLLLGLSAYVLGRAAGKKPDFGVVRDQLPRVPQYAIVLLVAVPVTFALSFLQRGPGVPVTPANPFAAFSIRNTLQSLFAWPIVLLQHSASFEIVLDRNVDGLQALRRAAKVLSYRPIGTLWAAFLIGLIVFVSFGCCFIPGIFMWPFALLAFATLYLAARTPGRSG